MLADPNRFGRGPHVKRGPDLEIGPYVKRGPDIRTLPYFDGGQKPTIETLPYPSSGYDFGNVREETYEECVMRNAGSGGTGPEDDCRGKPRQIRPLPEERVQYFLNNPEEAMPKSNGNGAAFLNGYIESNFK